MHILQKTPDETATYYTGAECLPLATLKSPHGSVMHIVEDDHCMVLVATYAEKAKGLEGPVVAPVEHWPAEAVAALSALA